MSALSVTAPTSEAMEPATGVGLLTPQEVADTLRSILGPDVPETQIARATAALEAAQDARWERLPKEIHEDMGFNLGFLPCSETCWMGRQVLTEGATFQVFRLRA
ncbi:MAG TPA: hypothetical protein VFN74_21135 [Chloroflexota bacterium]|jgi:hypothetical protein|nr:hypothetical protein [Chloroflexota bacterium]